MSRSWATSGDGGGWRYVGRAQGDRHCGAAPRPAWFAARGVTVERVLSDNGSAYRSHAWRAVCAEVGIKPERTRPYRPQTNGKIERFHRTLADGWAFRRMFLRRMFLSESARRKALPGWLHGYNHHRPHTAIGRRPPITRLTNLSGQYH